MPGMRLKFKYGRQFTCKVKRHERVLPFQNANIWQVKIIKIITTLIWLQTLHYVLRIFPRFTCKSEKVLSHHVISVSDHTARGSPRVHESVLLT